MKHTDLDDENLLDVMPECASSPTILLAEDDAEMRILLAAELARQGYSVLQCANGLELLDYLALDQGRRSRLRTIRLIITDIRMPGVTGLQVLAGSREIEDMPPVIIITAFGDERTHELARELGAAATFDKPFDFADLMAVVQKLTAGKGDDES